MTKTYYVKTKSGETARVSGVVGIGFNEELGTVGLIGEDESYMAVLPINNIDIILREDA